MDMDCRKRRSTVASDLPEDSLLEILARVPARSLCRSKCVAKAWRDLIEDPFHRKKLPQILQGFFSITKDTCGLHISYVSLFARSARLQVDPSLSFLTKLPGFQKLTFLNSCNGLLVFEHADKSLGYVVCNPTTKQWGAVPRCDPPPPSSSTCHTGPMYMYLVFDPAVSSHFHLLQFVRGWEDDHNNNNDDEDDSNDDEDEASASVNVYSSESGQWIHIENDWYKHDIEEWDYLGSSCAVLNGMLHFIVYSNETVQIACVDVQGVTRKIISEPIEVRMTSHWPQSHYVAQSQGCLHYINIIAGEPLSIWVLEDYDTQKWVLKHSVNLMMLFERMHGWENRRGHKRDYNVVAMHPDRNMVFLDRDRNRKLISYDIDHKLVNVIGTLENGTSTKDVVPYVPCFLESPALTNTL